MGMGRHNREQAYQPGAMLDNRNLQAFNAYLNQLQQLGQQWEHLARTTPPLPPARKGEKREKYEPAITEQAQRFTATYNEIRNNIGYILQSTGNKELYAAAEKLLPATGSRLQVRKPPFDMNTVAQLRGIFNQARGGQQVVPMGYDMYGDGRGEMEGYGDPRSPADEIEKPRIYLYEDLVAQFEELRAAGHTPDDALNYMKEGILKDLIERSMGEWTKFEEAMRPSKEEKPETTEEEKPGEPAVAFFDIEDVNNIVKISSS